MIKKESLYICVISYLFCFCFIWLLCFKVSAQHPGKIDMKCLLASITSQKNCETDKRSRWKFYFTSAWIRLATVYTAKNCDAVLCRAVPCQHTFAKRVIQHGIARHSTTSSAFRPAKQSVPCRAIQCWHALFCQCKRGIRSWFMYWTDITYLCVNPLQTEFTPQKTG